MANIFFNLPTFAANQAGTPVDVSSMGALKTVTVNKTGSVFQPFVTIEVSCDAAGVVWTPLKTFQGAGQQTFLVACMWMRASVSNYRSGGAPNVDVAGVDNSTASLDLPALAGNGSGAPVDVSALPNFKTIQVGGAFRGAVNVELSVDGNDYETVASFSASKAFTSTFAAQFMRVSRSGVPLVDPGQPQVSVAATEGTGSGGTGNAQRFSYVVTGAEPDLMELEIPLPAARLDALYLVFPSQGTASFQYAMNVANASRTTTEFVLSLSAEATAGDVFWFDVVDPT